jgi:hypothetical protein
MPQDKLALMETVRLSLPRWATMRGGATTPLEVALVKIMATDWKTYKSDAIFKQTFANPYVETLRVLNHQDARDLLQTMLDALQQQQFSDTVGFVRDRALAFKGEVNDLTLKNLVDSFKGAAGKELPADVVEVGRGWTHMETSVRSIVKVCCILLLDNRWVASMNLCSAVFYVSRGLQNCE